MCTHCKLSLIGIESYIELYIYQQFIQDFMFGGRHLSGYIHMYNTYYIITNYALMVRGRVCTQN